MKLPIKGEYPKEWPRISFDTKTAADWQCVRCKHPFDLNGAPLPCEFGVCDKRRGAHQKRGMLLPDAIASIAWAGISYTVHHLDGDKANCRWWNLLPLCNSCHLTVQARVLPERPWIFPHTDWFRIYVAGFYAFYYGALDVTRDDAECNLQQYLDLGQPWLTGHAAT